MVKRGELYRIEKPSKRDPKGFRVFVIVSRQDFIATRYHSVICAPVYSTTEGLPTQVEVGIKEGLKHDSAVRCDELVSLPKSAMTNYVGTLSEEKIVELNQSLKVALELEGE